MNYFKYLFALTLLCLLIAGCGGGTQNTTELMGASQPVFEDTTRQASVSYDSGGYFWPMFGLTSKNSRKQDEAPPYGGFTELPSWDAELALPTHSNPVFRSVVRRYGPNSKVYNFRQAYVVDEGSTLYCMNIDSQQGWWSIPFALPGNTELNMSSAAVGPRPEFPGHVTSPPTTWVLENWIYVLDDNGGFHVVEDSGLTVGGQWQYGERFDVSQQFSWDQAIGSPVLHGGVSGMEIVYFAGHNLSGNDTLYAARILEIPPESNTYQVAIASVLVPGSILCTPVIGTDNKGYIVVANDGIPDATAQLIEFGLYQEGNPGLALGAMTDPFPWYDLPTQTDFTTLASPQWIEGGWGAGPFISVPTPNDIRYYTAENEGFLTLVQMTDSFGQQVDFIVPASPGYTINSQAKEATFKKTFGGQDNAIRAVFVVENSEAGLGNTWRIRAYRTSSSYFDPITPLWTSQEFNGECFSQPFKYNLNDGINTYIWVASDTGLKGFYPFDYIAWDELNLGWVPSGTGTVVNGSLLSQNNKSSSSHSRYLTIDPYSKGDIFVGGDQIEDPSKGRMQVFIYDEADKELLSGTVRQDYEGVITPLENVPIKFTERIIVDGEVVYVYLGTVYSAVDGTYSFPASMYTTVLIEPQDPAVGGYASVDPLEYEVAVGVDLPGNKDFTYYLVDYPWEVIPLAFVENPSRFVDITLGHDASDNIYVAWDIETNVPGQGSTYDLDMVVMPYSENWPPPPPPILNVDLLNSPYPAAAEDLSIAYSNIAGGKTGVLYNRSEWPGGPTTHHAAFGYDDGLGGAHYVDLASDPYVTWASSTSLRGNLLREEWFTLYQFGSWVYLGKGVSGVWESYPLVHDWAGPNFDLHLIGNEGDYGDKLRGAVKRGGYYGNGNLTHLVIREYPEAIETVVPAGDPNAIGIAWLDTLLLAGPIDQNIDEVFSPVVFTHSFNEEVPATPIGYLDAAYIDPAGGFAVSNVETVLSGGSNYPYRTGYAGDAVFDTVRNKAIIAYISGEQPVAETPNDTCDLKVAYSPELSTWPGSWILRRIGTLNGFPPDFRYVKADLINGRLHVLYVQFEELYPGGPTDNMYHLVLVREPLN